jgi:hypothetical protein
MPITLSELRDAVQRYLKTQVTLAISPTTAKIKPNANFTFDITVTNPNAVSHGIRLVNVRYHVKVQTPAVAKLVVPATNPDFDGIRYKGLEGLNLVDLAPKAEVAEMYLFPSASSTSSTINRAGDLDVGTSDTIRVTGKGFGSSGTTTGIDCSIKADPDLDYLFPKDEESPSSPATVNIVDT